MFADALHRADTPRSVSVMRRLDSPPERVFDAWLDSKSFGTWISSERDAEIKRISLQGYAGGGFIVTLQTAGAVIWIAGNYITLERPRRIEFTFSESLTGYPANVTVAIDPHDNGSMIRLTQEVVDHAPEEEAILRERWSQTLARLGRALAEHSLQIDRLVKASPDLVFEMWTEERFFAQWCCPNGFEIVECGIDLRVGGAWWLRMRAPSGSLHRMEGVYTRIEPQGQLEFTHHWMSAEGVPGPETTVTVTLSAHSQGCRMQLTQGPFATKSARDMHENGWTQCAGKLEARLDQAGTGSPGAEASAPC